MHLVKRYLILPIFFIVTSSCATNRVFYYEPVITTLCGAINIKTLPGPPNYESTKNGDRAETSYYIVLKKSITVKLPPKRTDVNVNDEFVKSIQVLQLAIMNNKLWPNIKKGNDVAVTGTLYYWQNAHHHTKVLMAVNKAHTTKKGYTVPRLVLRDGVIKCYKTCG